jgi:6-pyruvoyl-tetrahydropterin synthase
LQFCFVAGVAGLVQTETGKIINFSNLSATIKNVLEGYDHRYLNTQLDDEPTTPNTARALWADLNGRLQLDCVELIEATTLEM